jgi:hypothetical protein
MPRRAIHHNMANGVSPMQSQNNSQGCAASGNLRGSPKKFMPKKPTRKLHDRNSTDTTVRVRITSFRRFQVVE